MVEYSIVVIDDEETIRQGIVMALETDYKIRAFGDAETALKAIGGAPPDLVLLDIGLPGMNGIEALDRLKSLCRDLLVIMITAYEDINSVVSAMKLGAYDYLVKPIHMDSLEIAVRNALGTIRLRKEVQALQQRYLEDSVPCFVGESNAILDVMEFIGIVARSPDTPVLVLGETGTGKELVAAAIHYRSPNFKGSLVPVNCAAISKDLIESELFGYEKGAFSGALLTGKKGLVEEAAGGTLFLDEVGDLGLEAQAKLLRFLETGEFYRIGGTRKQQVRARVVSATNKDLGVLMEKGLFRKDLFFRLGVIKVKVPSLKERRDDIIPLAKHFLLHFNLKFGKKVTSISPAAEEALVTHRWEGNVRELKNIIEKASLTAKGTELSAHDLDLADGREGKKTVKPREGIFFPPLSDSGIDLSEAERSMEVFYLREALRIAGGNESRAAALVNLNHHTFRYRIRKLGIK
jgi:two-component system response regulator AtoC